MKFRTMRFKHQARHYVWCDYHGEIHPAIEDYYEERSLIEGCIPENWRRVWVETDDPEEWFDAELPRHRVMR